MKNFLSQLNEIEYNEAISTNIDTSEKLIQLLLKRVHPHNIEILVDILKQAIAPSISQEINNDVDILFDYLKSDPKQVFEKNNQLKIEKFITLRIEKDKEIVIQKTSDISKLVVLMEEYLNEAIVNSGKGEEKVLNIKEKIKSIDLSKDGIGALDKIQNELVSAADMIGNEIINITNNLEKGRTKVQELEEKVNNLEKKLQKTKEENRKDFLTQVLTRKAFNEDLRKIESLYKRENTQFAVVFFDIDNFKVINDTYGHEGGDVILSTFGKVLNKSVREHDLVGRYGGEEFIAIVHFNLDRELLGFLKRIKTVVTQNSFVYLDKKIKVTFSAGVSLRDKYPTYDMALSKADELLYKAKQSGKNKILLDNGIEI